MPFRIDHIGIAVKSIQHSRKLYEYLGFAVLHEEVVTHEKVNTALIPCGESRIELLEATSPDSPIQKFLEKRGEGLHHVAIHVDDISATFENMKADGVRFVSDDIRVGAGGHLYAFIHPSSAGGVLVEIGQDPISAI
ncbi:MAG: methylmalonyl-CoA epimerase [Acidobacteriaceae bacterium]